MAFYCKNLDKVIFEQHNYLPEEPDELIIISGYLGPNPVDNLQNLPFKKMEVIGGMYTRGVNSSLYDALKEAQLKNPRLTVSFSNLEVHSKIYIWLKNDEVKRVLIGSANFSDNGLKTDLRESLAEMNFQDTQTLMDYIKLIKQNSTVHPQLADSSTIKKNIANTSLINNDDINKGPLSVELPLYVDNKGIRTVSEKSGLNWGLADAHTAEGDAYIAIPKPVISAIPNFFLPFNPNYQSSKKRKRASDPIEIIWDDGTVMQASTEGKQKYNNLYYPKQISSYSDKSRKELGHSAKSIIGRYLRNRMNIPIDKLITYDDLKNYGRISVTFTKISDGVYQADFSK